jgi:hypothetical protein
VGDPRFWGDKIRDFWVEYQNHCLPALLGMGITILEFDHCHEQDGFREYNNICSDCIVTLRGFALYQYSHFSGPGTWRDSCSTGLLTVGSERRLLTPQLIAVSVVGCGSRLQWRRVETLFL